ncbi:MAG: hypothetical protein IJ094_09255 [Bacilli bacterium]|nr:hypothetical protein [Bacilli bacterium]
MKYVDDKETISKIKEKYVKNNSALIKIPFKGYYGITFFDESGIKYHEYDKSNLFINKYTDDERRFSFPDSNMPISYKRKGLKKYKYINQIIDFEKPYIIISNGNVIELYAVKSGDEAILFDSLLLPEKREFKILTKEELEKLINDKLVNDSIFTPNGGIYTDQIITPMNQIVQKLYDRKTGAILSHDYDEIGNLRDIIEDIENNISIEGRLKLIDDINVLNAIVLYKDKDEINELKHIRAKLYDIDKYEIEISALPIKKYAINQNNKYIDFQVDYLKDSKVDSILAKKI